MLMRRFPGRGYGACITFALARLAATSPTMSPTASDATTSPTTSDPTASPSVSPTTPAAQAECCEYVTVFADETMGDGAQVFNGINATGLYRLEQETSNSSGPCADRLLSGGVYYTKVEGTAYTFDIYFNSNMSRWFLDHDGNCSFSLNDNDGGGVLSDIQPMAASTETAAGGCPSDPTLQQGWRVNIGDLLNVSVPAAVSHMQWPSFDVSCAVVSVTPTPQPSTQPSSSAPTPRLVVPLPVTPTPQPSTEPSSSAPTRLVVVISGASTPAETTGNGLPTDPPGAMTWTSF